MTTIYKSAGSARRIHELYREILSRWPVPSQHLRLPTREGETFVIACGPESAPPLLLFHGAGANSATWIADVPKWAAHFRVYAVDMIGEPGLSAPCRPSLSSDAHALWLDDVVRGLSLEHVAIVGVSLGGWLALDYAIRRPERVERLALFCPGGVGRQKVAIVFAALALRMCGPWGKRKLMQRILGRRLADPTAGVKAFIDFVELIHEQFRPRMVKLPIFPDHALRRLKIPLLAVVGGRDVILDSLETKRRLERQVPGAEVVYLPTTGHFIPDLSGRTLPFLLREPSNLRSIPPPMS